MKLYGATMLRNEADIVEPFVRHNLTALDGLIVVDHGSQDGTSEILAALVAEGLPIEVEHDASVEYLQSEIMTRTARRLFAERGADFVFALDADEFLKVPSRRLLEDTLERVPSAMHAAMQWQTYVADYRPGTPSNVLALATRRLAQERHGLFKVIVARCLAESPDAVIAEGNHVVLPSAEQHGCLPRSLRPDSVIAEGNHVVLPSAGHSLAKQPLKHARVSPSAVALAHLPVRSARQLVNKILIGWLAHCAARRSNPDLAFHWRELYHEISNGHELTPARLAMIAANYGLPMNAWLAAESLALIDDPLPVGEVRYSHLARQETLPLVLKFAERLALSSH